MKKCWTRKLDQAVINWKRMPGQSSTLQRSTNQVFILWFPIHLPKELELNIIKIIQIYFDGYKSVIPLNLLLNL